MFLKKYFTIIVLFFLAANSFAAHSKQPIAPDSVYFYMKKVADWQWHSLATSGWKDNPKDWTNGAMYTGMLAWAKIANDETYYLKLVDVGNSTKWQIGGSRFFADDYCIGAMYSQLFKIYKNPVYISDFKKMADSLVGLPHTESLLWKNNIHLREWAWCDALFMGPPSLADLSDATGDQKYLNKACELWWKSSDFLYDKDEDLFFRDSRYFTQKEKNGKKVFWSRGNGWVMAGMARLLSVMPDDHPDRKKFIIQFKQMAKRIASLQQPDGSWHASLLDPASYSGKETSGTGFFCYALAWGINQKILPYKQFYPIVNKAWKALTTSVHPDGKLGYVQPQGAAPDKVGFDDTEVYGVGAFLLAGSEMLKLNNIHH